MKKREEYGEQRGPFQLFHKLGADVYRTALFSSYWKNGIGWQIRAFSFYLTLQGVITVKHKISKESG